MLCQLLFLFVLGTRPWRANPTEGNRHVKPRHEPPPPTTGSGTTNTTLNYTNLINKKVGGEPTNPFENTYKIKTCAGGDYGNFFGAVMSGFEPCRASVLWPSAARIGQEIQPESGERGWGSRAWGSRVWGSRIWGSRVWGEPCRAVRGGAVRGASTTSTTSATSTLPFPSPFPFSLSLSRL